MTVVTVAVVTVVIVTYFSKKQLDTSTTDEISQGSFSRSCNVFWCKGGVVMCFFMNRFDKQCVTLYQLNNMSHY